MTRKELIDKYKKKNIEKRALVYRDYKKASKEDKRRLSEIYKELLNEYGVYKK